MKRFFKRTLVILALLYAVLLIPDARDKKVQATGGVPFAWNKDHLWTQLENDFKAARSAPKAILDSSIKALSSQAEKRLTALAASSFEPGDARIDSLLATFFSAAPLIAAQPGHTGWIIDYYSRARQVMKNRSQQWDMKTNEARNTLYKALYGMRAAVEEVLLQSGKKSFNPVMLVTKERSAALSTNVLGIEVHSGDLLLSRGGAEVSALISRGNDHPGNFSHVALMYIDEKSRIPYLIEAHIEKGVAFATVDQYIKDKKLRFMVLRPRADLPQLANDPLLPHKAAALIYEEAGKRKIPYDFKMNFFDSSAMFCSEVGSYAYGKSGIRLWQPVSTISSAGAVSWLHTFGVENFVTQMPSDLEYDPQLSVVGEWRDPASLLKDHIDNAVMDVLLESADKGEEIDYDILKLPLARVLKGWCMLLNMFGKQGLIPEGMSATQALKNNSFVEKHAALRAHTEALVDGFIRSNGYTPPYWQLVALARQAKEGR